MSRIDVQTLVLVFEKRIAALDKNPPDVISMSVIINMLEKAIDEEISSHFKYIIKEELRVLLKKEFEKLKGQYIKSAVKNILCDTKFKALVEDEIKKSILNGIKQGR